MSLFKSYSIACKKCDGRFFLSHLAGRFRVVVPSQCTSIARSRQLKICSTICDPVVNRLKSALWKQVAKVAQVLKKRKF